LINPDHYTYRITWSEEDGEYVGLCTEYPSLSHLAPSRGEALEGISTLVSDVAAELTTNGESVPELKVACLMCT
jgi:predicted RNase H-like HicB family nuclease